MNFGNLFIVGFEGAELNPELKSKLIKLQPAGVILYDTNITNKEQCRKLISDLKQVLGEDLIISVDQEGGKVERLRKINSSLPSLAAVGQASVISQEPLITHSHLLASELLELGFNFVFAPCADLQSNPLNPIIGTRALGKDPDIVAKQLQVIIDSYHQAGLKCCAKHFPGHGSSSLDSHLALPQVEINQNELKPFIASMEANVDAIMIAHLLVTNIDKDNPASISSKIIQEHLIKQLGFSGLIVSDEITMKALTAYGDYIELAQRLILAGNDLVIWNTNIDDALATALALNSRNSLKPRYQQSLDKIEKFKALKYQPQKITVDANAMLNIVRQAIEQPHKTIVLNDKTAALIYQHPKLEIDMIKNILKLDTFIFKDISSLDSINLKQYQNLLIISFQADIIPAQQKAIEYLKDLKQWSIFHCSTDVTTTGSDLELLGSSKVHFQALVNLFS